MDAAEQWEPDEARASRPVLRARGGEIPPRDSPEHRLFLTATPHNGHSNSFSALLEMLDQQRPPGRFIVRSAPRPAASLALRAAGVALQPTVRDATAS